MTEALETATAGGIKQTDTFLLYVLFTGAGFGGGYFGPRYTYHTDSSQHIHWRTFFTVLAVLLTLLLLVSIVLHGVFMSIVQGKLNKLRGSSLPLQQQG